MRQRGLDPDVESVPLPRVMELCIGAYGGEQFRRLFADAALSVAP